MKENMVKTMLQKVVDFTNNFLSMNLPMLRKTDFITLEKTKMIFKPSFIKALTKLFLEGMFN
jgi:hypothetical protein